MELLRGLKVPCGFDRSETPVLEGNEFLTMVASSLRKWYVVPVARGREEITI